MGKASAKGRVKVTVWLEEEMLEAVEGARRQTRVTEDRSTFIRQAIAGRLDELGAGYVATRSAARTRGLKVLLPRV